jgi:hypothetical protein
MTTSTLEQLQSAVANLLLADGVFTGASSANNQPIPVITEKVGDMLNDLQQKIIRFGLGVIVVTPNFVMQNKKEFDFSADVNISVQASEHVTLNQGSSGTQIPCLRLACRITELLQWQPHNVGPWKGGQQQNPDPKFTRMHLLNAQMRFQGGQTVQGKVFEPVLSYVLTFKTSLVISTG